MIHYKHSNPSSINNTTSGYALNDFWVNIVTYTKYEQISNGEWVWRESNYGSEMSYQRLNQQAGSIVTNDSLYGDGTLDNPLTNKPKLDFMLVDGWQDNEGYIVPDGFVGNANSRIVSLMDGHISIITWDVEGGGLGLTIYGYGSNPFVPIPQNIIFVHPTTFERYRFNGTEMVVYNDIHGIVPKWLEWIGKISANYPLVNIDTDIKIKPLNRDAGNYMGDLSQYPISSTPDLIELSIKPNKFTLDMGFIVSENANDNNGQGITWATDGDGNVFAIAFEQSFDNVQLQLKQRLRGAPPKLLKAETNETGDKVILTFDKEMNIEYFSTPGASIEDYILVMTDNPNTQVYFDSATLSTDKKVITLTASNGNILYSDSVSLSNLGAIQNLSNYMESLDYGLLQPFDNFPVTNNVPAPPQLIDAYTNETGDKVTLVFDKDIQVIIPNNGVWSDGVNGGSLVDDWLYFTDVLYPPFPPSTYSPIVDGNKITYDVQHDIPLDNTTQLFINYITNQGGNPFGDLITSLDGGILQPFYDYPVTNNVPAPPQLIDAYTNETGNKVTLVFDKDIKITLPEGGEWYNGMNGGVLFDDYLYIHDLTHDCEITPDAYAQPLYEINGNTISYTITHDDIIYGSMLGDEINLMYNGLDNFITSLDGGVLQPFYDYPVTNNII